LPSLSFSSLYPPLSLSLILFPLFKSFHVAPGERRRIITISLYASLVSSISHLSAPLSLHLSLSLSLSVPCTCRQCPLHDVLFSPSALSQGIDYSLDFKSNESVHFIPTEFLPFVHVFSVRSFTHTHTHTHTHYSSALPVVSIDLPP